MDGNRWVYALLLILILMVAGDTLQSFRLQDKMDKLLIMKIQEKALLQSYIDKVNSHVIVLPRIFNNERQEKPAGH